jgi:hypothetical protein
MFVRNGRSSLFGLVTSDGGKSLHKGDRLALPAQTRTGAEQSSLFSLVSDVKETCLKSVLSGRLHLAYKY